MPDNSVTTHFFASEKEAVAAIARLEKKYDDLENKVKHAHQSSKEGAGHALESIKELGTMAITAGLGFTSLIGGVEKFIDVSKEARREAEAAAAAADRLANRLNIQSGRFGAEGEKNIGAVNEAALTSGRSREETGRLFAALQQRGKLTPEEAAGAIGGQATAFAATFEASGGNLSPEGYASALAASLDKEKKKTPEALGEASRNLFAAMQGTNLTTDDITAAAHQLSTLGATEKARARLAAPLHELGLKFEDINLQGEDVFEATARFRTGLERVKDPGRREQLKELIFGDSTLANRLIGAEGQMKGKGGLFEKSIEEAATGRDQQAARYQLATELNLEGKANKTQLYLQALDLQMREEGWSDFRRTTGMGMHRFNEFSTQAVGFSGHTQEEFAGMLGKPERFNEIVKALEGGNESADEMKSLLEKIEENTRLMREEKEKPKGKPRRGGD